MNVTEMDPLAPDNPGVSEKTRKVKPRAVASVLAELCTGCGICVKSCPSNVIAIVVSELNFNGIAQVETGCTGCNICAIDCPWTAIEMLFPDGTRKEPSTYAKQAERLRGHR